MKLLIALAFVALAAAAPEALPIEIPSPTPVKVVAGPTPTANAVSSETQVSKTRGDAVNPTTEEVTPKKVAAPAPKKPEDAEKVSPVHVADAPVQSKVAEEGSPVKVVDTPVKTEGAEKINPVKVAETPVDSKVAENVSPAKVADIPADSQVAVKVTPVKVIGAPVEESKAAEKVSPLKVADIPSDTVTVKITPVKVIDAPIDTAKQTFQILSKLYNQNLSNISAKLLEVKLDDPEAMLKLYKDARSLIDISPAYVSRDVMLQADMDANVINVGGAHPFSFNNAEPLDNVVPVKVVDGPLDELDYKMDPVVMIQPQDGQQDIPDSVKVIDGIVPRKMWRGPAPMKPEQNVVKRVHFQEPVKGIVPREMWRGPTPMNQEQKVQEPVKGIVPREMWRGPTPLAQEQKVDFQKPVKGIVPREMWRGPAPMNQKQNFDVQGPEMWRGPAPKPTYWRDLPDVPMHHRNMILRNEYRMPPAAYRDPALR